ncbi:hypothetical protein [Thermococcus sp. JdF3]|uniref:hypothetical protein n=1 Tax=Thermococcus sp. JdF3 TaxID=1638258 RepID=UPI001439AEEE|nr:hypothetical protein [Thermococcus sp. JdF3]NJE01991.1 hypothetical protein [Thermococcus sp. JdF3]
MVISYRGGFKKLSSLLREVHGWSIFSSGNKGLFRCPSERPPRVSFPLEPSFGDGRIFTARKMKEAFINNLSNIKQADLKTGSEFCGLLFITIQRFLNFMNIVHENV